MNRVSKTQRVSMMGYPRHVLLLSVAQVQEEKPKHMNTGSFWLCRLSHLVGQSKSSGQAQGQKAEKYIPPTMRPSMLHGQIQHQWSNPPMDVRKKNGFPNSNLICYTPTNLSKLPSLLLTLLYHIMILFSFLLSPYHYLKLF